MKLFALAGEKVSIPENGDGWAWNTDEFEARLTHMRGRPKWRFWWRVGASRGSGSAREKDEAHALLVESIARSWRRLVRTAAVLDGIVRGTAPRIVK